MTAQASFFVRLITRRKLSAFICSIASTIFGLELIPFTLPAHAAVADLTCEGTETTQYNPGVRLTPQINTVKVDGVLGSPVSCISSDSSIRLGTYKITGTGLQLTCDQLDNPVSPDITFKWNNGESSTVHFTSTSSNTVGAALVIESIGYVASGRFAGDSVNGTVSILTTDLTKCATTGITTLTGATTVTFTQVP